MFTGPAPETSIKPTDDAQSSLCVESTEPPRLRCLIVEDDEDYVILVREYLSDISNCSFDLVWEADFDAALSRLSDETWDICFVDIFLGGRNGMDLIAEAKQRGLATPIILLTGAMVSEVELEAPTSGAADFIPKQDLSPETLSRTIRFAIANAEKSAALNEQRTLLRLTIDNTKHGIALFDTNSHLITCNAVYLNIYGFDAEVVRPGISLREILKYSIALGNYAEQDVERILAEREAQISLSQASSREQRLRDGRTISVHHKALDGGLSVTTCEDITESLREKRRHAELMREAALAEAEDCAKANFLSNMSHELRTPLNAIIGFSDVMQQELLGPLGSEQYKGYAKDIRNAATEMKCIVEQLLDIERLLEGQVQIEETVFALRDVVRSAVDSYRDAAKEKGLRVQSFSDGAALLLRGDREKLDQVVGCIVDNAIKFSPPGGAVTISVNALESGAALAVSDMGVGIEESLIQEMLSPFGQRERAEVRRRHGAGLGLPIALGLLRLHGGDIEIDSDLDIGTTVRLRLPAERIIAPPACDGALPVLAPLASHSVTARLPCTA